MEASNTYSRLLRPYRIIPLSAAIYFLCNLDRSNIGNARILNSTTKNDMQTELQMTPVQFNVALMIFLIGYFVSSFTPERRERQSKVAC
jgi:hypothetical protein